jgi:hypothetical protein
MEVAMREHETKVSVSMQVIVDVASILRIVSAVVIYLTL